MGLFPKPHTTLTDAEVADALSRAVTVIDPLLDLLAQADPIGLRRRTRRLPAPPHGLTHRIRRFRLRRRRHEAGRGPSAADRALNAGAQLLNAADLPGTAAWERMSRDQRAHWWVHRVGALNTLVVASPGAFGVLARVVPVGQLAGFVNQAVVLCALAREYGVTDRDAKVRLLAEVLCGRHLPETLELPAPSDPPPLPESPPPGWKPLRSITSSTPVVMTRTVWQLAGILRATFDEVGKRPHPKKLYQHLGSLPGLGLLASYFGERGALIRAARAGEAWLQAREDGAEAGGVSPL
ncbi:hypothetical protein [Mycolicibacter hiberniae]|uniref:Uncharacterized protein n=1 Tax=Mycolicibacter hiberniae TaxID=29314 RepID=A0A7I7X759_9MYCO|nr:hypothetical protein [Mycolicibacter hiberniae]MCV7087379.1 hypothetical protein [Mycolicibacter hiberniae]ORV67657.1 hypothetical protein AWC09_15840 [Mycolicibacter hiberniae]BBZ25404.1 hypothetical protein MHIB_38220 [Mycolicibacter hiberniae]